MCDKLDMRMAEVMSLRGYFQKVSPLAQAVDSKLWRILPQLHKEDAELIQNLVKVARYETSQD